MGMLDGKVAVVTGAASGIGRAGAVLMAQEGARVVVADLDETGGHRVATTIGPDRAEVVRVDVTETQSVQQMVGQAVDRFSRIDVLFHNAMSVPLVNDHDRRVTELPEQIWDAIIRLALTGTFLCTKYVGQQMIRQQSGSIVLTATSDALIGQAGIDAYTAAKGGVVSMTRSMAAGLARDGIRVNTICPGFVNTPHQSVFMNDPAQRRTIESLSLLPISEPQEVAQLAVFLASDRASTMTGGIHPVDAGYTAFKGNVDLSQVFKRS